MTTCNPPFREFEIHGKGLGEGGLGKAAIFELVSYPHTSSRCFSLPLFHLSILK
jgi:hypothetical protein